MNGVSIIICCYNSSTRIKKTLEYLSVQQFQSNFNCEIIIVDNNCSDGTSEVSKQYWEQLGCSIPFQIIKEPIPGLTWARIGGAKKAKYDYILFCDDDNWLARDYVNNAFLLLESNPEIGALGGKTKEFFINPSNTPIWFGNYKSSFAIGEQNPISGDVSKRKYLWGAGLIVRRKLFLFAMELYPPLLSDRVANGLSSGGDSEICARILLSGYKLYYDNTLFLYHFIPEERLTNIYLERLMIGHQLAYKTLHIYWQYIDYCQHSFFIRLAKCIKDLAYNIYSLLIRRRYIKSNWYNLALYFKKYPILEYDTYKKVELISKKLKTYDW